MCKVCDEIYNAVADSFSPIPDETLNEVIAGVFSKEFTVNAPPSKLFLQTGQSLTDAIRSAFEYDKFAAKEATPKYKLAADMQKNVYRFSAAKTYQQTKALNSLLIDEKGVAKTFQQFKKDATPILKTFNQNYLAAEHQRAFAASQNAIYWDEIIRDQNEFPLLKYETVGDQRVRPTHQALDNIVRPVNDVFWTNYMPPNGWNCRCTVFQLMEGDAPQTDLTNFVKPKDVPDEFMYNPGQQRVVFTETHPYFKVEARDSGLAANNFNLPMPKSFPTPELVAEPNVVVDNSKFIPKNWGELDVEINKDIFNKLEKPIELKIVKKGGSSHSNSVLTIDTGQRWQKSKFHREKVLYHEIGHAIHNQKNLITWLKISDEYAAHFKTLRALVKKDALKINNELDLLYAKTFNEARKAELIEKYGANSIEDVREMIASASDSLMSLTNSKYGQGHTKSYMKLFGSKEAEMFAHSMENYYGGNKVFEELMPEVYNESIKFIKNIK